RKNENSLPAFRGAKVDRLNHSPDLVHFDHHLRRIGWDDENIRMGLNEEPRFLLFGFFHPITRFSRLSAPRLQVFKLTKADAIRALAAKIRETVCDRAVE